MKTIRRRSFANSFCVLTFMMVLLGAQSFAHGAQNTGAIEGKITDPLGALVPQATVTLNSSGKRVAAMTSNEDGMYRFAGLPEGVYQITAERQGFKPQTLSDIFLPRGATRTVDIILPVGPLKEEVVITATATEVPQSQLGASLSTLDEEGIRRQGKLDLLEAVRIVPGLQVAQTGGHGGITSIFVRGGNNSFNKVLIDGAPVNQVGGIFDFATLTAANIERIEVLRGPNSVLYGSDAVSSVINVITKRAREQTNVPTFAYSAEGGSHHSFRQEVSILGAFRSFDYNSNFSRFDTDNNVINGTFSNGTYSGNFGWQPSVNSEVRFAIRHVAAAAGNPNAVDFFGISDDSATRDRETYLSISGRNQTTRRWRNQVRFASAQLLNRYTNPGPTGEPFDPFGFGPNYLGAPVTIVGGNGFRVSGRAILDFGGSYPQTFTTDTARQSIYAQSDYRFGEMLIGTFGFRYENERGTSGSSRIFRNNFSYFLQGQYSMAARLFTTAGVGFENNAVFGLDVNPRVSLAYFLRKRDTSEFFNETKVKLNFGTGIKEPSIFQEGSSLFKLLLGAGPTGKGLIARFGIAPIGPERSRSFDVGVEQRLWHNRARLSVTYFDNRFTDLIEFVPASALPLLGVPSEVVNAAGFGANLNSQDFRAFGAEVELEADLGRGLVAQGSYTYLDAKVIKSFSSSALTPTMNPTFPGIPIGAFSPLVGARPFQRSPHVGSLFVSYARSHWSFGVTGYFASRRDTSTFLSDQFFGPSLLLPNRNLNPGYQKVDVGGQYKISKNFALFATMENVLNQPYSEVFGYPALKLNFRAGGKITWGGGDSWRNLFR